MGGVSPGLCRGRKDLETLLHSALQHLSKELIAGGDLHLGFIQGSSHMLTDINHFLLCIG